MSDTFPPGWGPSNTPGNSRDPWGAPDTRVVLAYAGFWIRVAANLIDQMILGGIALILKIFSVPVVSLSWQRIGGSGNTFDIAYRPDMPVADSMILMPHVHANSLAWLTSTLIPLLYFIVLEASLLRGTLGKRALGLQVTDMHGNRISLGVSAVRSLIKWFVSFPVLCIGVLMVAFTPRKQGLHDLIARTLVLHTTRTPTF